jgi:preprotein translocase subunit YajC
MEVFVVIVLLFVFAWLFVIRPSRRRTDSHQAMQDSIEVGDEIITAGGIHGVVREAEDDRLRIEIAPGVVVTLDRRAVAAVAREVEVELEGPDEPGEAPDDEAPDSRLEAEPR